MVFLFQAHSSARSHVCGVVCYVLMCIVIGIFKVSYNLYGNKIILKVEMVMRHTHTSIWHINLFKIVY